MLPAKYWSDIALVISVFFIIYLFLVISVILFLLCQKWFAYLVNREDVIN